MQDTELMTIGMWVDYILEWNEKINLTAITEEDDFIEKHYIDSLKVCLSGGF